MATATVSQNDTPRTATLLGLPAELIQEILCYLTPLQLAVVASTCHILSTHSHDDQIWQPLVNANLPEPLSDPKPLKSFHDLYVAHHPHWFLPWHRIWFADQYPHGKLLVAKYNSRSGCVEAYAVTAQRGDHTLKFWEKDREVLIHSFTPRVSIDRNQPVLKLEPNGVPTEVLPRQNQNIRGSGPSSSYGKETLMDTFVEPGLYGSFMLCRTLPHTAVTEQTRVWPPLRLPADSRVRNDTQDGYSSSGHRPKRLAEVSEHNFRLRKWVEYTGRRANPALSFTSPNGLSAALGVHSGPYFASNMASSLGGGMSIRMQEDITTYATMPASHYSPTKEKPFQGIWCGDYSGHGCEFLVILQPDKQDEKPLPEGMDWLRRWFHGGRRGSASSASSYASAQEDLGIAGPSAASATAHVAAFDNEEEAQAAMESAALQQILAGFTEGPYQRPIEVNSEVATDYPNPPSGRLEAIKITGDPNIPRAEYTFIAPDIGHDGFMRVADEEIFLGARVVRCAGHIAGRGFREDQYTPSQLIMISNDRLAQFWEGFGHISYYQRVDLDALCLSLLRKSAREYYRTAEAECTTWSYFTPFPPPKASSTKAPIVRGLEIYKSKAALQRQVDDPVYFQSYHDTVKRDSLYAKPEELVAWYFATGFVAREANGETVSKPLISVTNMTCRDRNDVLALMEPFGDWVLANEPGVLTYAIFSRPKAPKELVLFVRYADVAALKAHSTAPEHVDIVKKLGMVLEGDISKTTTMWREVEDSFVSSIVGGGKADASATAKL